MGGNPNKFNSFKKPKKKELKPPFSLSQAKKSKLRLSLGFFLLALSIYLFIAFISYLFSGKADQSVVSALSSVDMVESGREASNWLGLYGAVLAHYFIFKWLGLSAFFIPPMLFFCSCYILFNNSLLPLLPAFIFSVFGGLWLSLLLGYITHSVAGVSAVNFITGGLGYELARIADGLLGWGTFLVLLLFLLVFAVYAFNITSLSLRANTARKDNGKASLQTDPSPLQPATDDPKKGRQEIVSETKSLLSAVESTSNTEVSTNKTAAVTEEDGTSSGIALTIEKQEKKRGEEKQEPSFTVEPPSKADTTSKKLVELHGNYDPTLDLSSFKFPPLTLLDDDDAGGAQVSQDELTQNKDKIVVTLTNFKVGIASIKATIGPTVTLYEIIPEAGVKISRIKNLEDDIALNLAAFGIRIIAPIPGKGTIGIEVPNKNREMVRIKHALAVKQFMQSNKDLPIAMGKTISNETLVVDLAKMPHLLVAGATGQGKSVGLNVILTSLLYKLHPSQIKFILVDPKKVEMSLFRKIERHYLAKMPNSEEAIITDTRRVVHTLNSLCIEMENRYEMMKTAGTRNIKEYNVKFTARKLNPNEGHRFLPYIVLIIDELADLMMTAGKEVETPIARLAQLARAIGIHLVVATQRPSVNVITGVIKANFPARLSFRVTSKVDSRTILDASGADQLIGHGDMLFSSGSDIVRLQCPFVSTHEVEKICDFIGEQKGYESAYLLPEFEGDDEGGVSNIDLSDRDSYFEEAARLVIAHQQGSASLIQRKLKLGYNRAGRIIDQLEAAGVVGAFEGSKAREVLISNEESLEQLLSDLKEKYAPL